MTPGPFYFWYGYDRTDRRTRKTHPGTGLTAYAGRAYAYDAAGNRTASTPTGLAAGAGASVTSTYSAADKLLSETATTPPATAGGSAATVVTTYAYDAAGNQTGSTKVTPGTPASGTIPATPAVTETTAYAYDAAGRMTETDTPTGGVVSYAHDHAGRRRAKADTGYWYEGTNLLAETDAAGDLTKTFGTSGQGAFGDVLYAEGGDGRFYPLYDLQESASVLTDEAGQVVARLKHGAFGDTALGTADGTSWTTFSADEWANLSIDGWASLPAELLDAVPIETLASFGGKRQYRLDPETNLYLLGAGTNGRYLDGRAGRFITEDPVREAAGDVNLYRYVFNDPVGNADPSGHALVTNQNHPPRGPSGPPLPPPSSLVVEGPTVTAGPSLSVIPQTEADSPPNMAPLDSMQALPGASSLPGPGGGLATAAGLGSESGFVIPLNLPAWDGTKFDSKKFYRALAGQQEQPDGSPAAFEPGVPFEAGLRMREQAERRHFWHSARGEEASAAAWDTEVTKWDEWIEEKREQMRQIVEHKDTVASSIKTGNKGRAVWAARINKIDLALQAIEDRLAAKGVTQEERAALGRQLEYAYQARMASSSVLTDFQLMSVEAQQVSLRKEQEFYESVTFWLEMVPFGSCAEALGRGDYCAAAAWAVFEVATFFIPVGKIGKIGARFVARAGGRVFAHAAVETVVRTGEKALAHAGVEAAGQIVKNEAKDVLKQSSAVSFERAAENAAVRTNAQLVEEIGARADAWGARQGLTSTAREIGTAKHAYAQDLLNRYQSMFGDRGLVTEQSFLNGVETRYGMPGSVRLDVWEESTGAVWDYKFGLTPMSAAQRAKIMMNAPGVTSITAVHP